MQIESTIGVIVILACIIVSTIVLVASSMLLGCALADLVESIKDYWKWRNNK